MKGNGKDNGDQTTAKEKAHQIDPQGESSLAAAAGPSVGTGSPLINDDLPRAPQRAQSAPLQTELTAMPADSQGELCTDELAS